MSDDTTTARRDLLLALIDRNERGVISDADRPLIRPLVEAEMAHGQAVIDQFTADSPWLKATAEDQAALQQRHEDLIAETRRQGDVHERTARRAAHAAAAIDRVHDAAVRPVPVHHGADVQHEGWARGWAAAMTSVREAIDGPAAPDATPAPDAVLCSPLVNANCPGHTDGGRCERAASSPVVTLAPLEWERIDAELNRRQTLLDANQAAPTEEPTL